MKLARSNGLGWSLSIEAACAADARPFNSAGGLTAAAWASFALAVAGAWAFSLVPALWHVPAMAWKAGSSCGEVGAFPAGASFPALGSVPAPFAASPLSAATPASPAFVSWASAGLPAAGGRGSLSGVPRRRGPQPPSRPRRQGPPGLPTAGPRRSSPPEERRPSRMARPEARRVV